MTFTSDRRKMGEFVNARWLNVLAWVTTLVILVLNLKLLSDFFGLSEWIGEV